MIPATIINAVRARLGDSRKERWNDATLLLYTSLCQNDICMFTHFHRKDTHITLEADKYIYDLPSDCLAVNRLEYNDQLLPIETRNNIDSHDVTYPLVLKDNLAYNLLEFKIGETYDSLATALVNVYGVVVASDTDAVDVDCGELDNVHGVLVDIDCSASSTPQPLDDVLVYYSAVPPLLVMDLTDIENPALPTEELIVPDIWFQAFLHYVCGMALQDDNDANNIQRGELEGTKYLRMLTHIQKTSSKDFTSNVRTKLTTNMRRI
ncbi:MAG: hypothetical protein DRQ78_09560 [Epsilonproteobacteria bacterium]|nr:MAG: hypothetical protein DRQ78_09560 [Campylobacterota bacterium]